MIIKQIFMEPETEVKWYFDSIEEIVVVYVRKTGIPLSSQHGTILPRCILFPLSWQPCWLTDSGHLTHKVIIRPASSLAQDRESSPAETSVLPTLLRSQLSNKFKLSVHSAYFLIMRYMNNQQLTIS